MNIFASIGNPSESRSRRAGFSLLELLVVIGVIAFITAAIVAVVPRVQNAARIAATRATIAKIDRLLNDRLDGFKRAIQTQDRMAGGGIPSYVDIKSLQDAGSLPNGQPNLPLAKILAIKKPFRENFCQSYSELSTLVTTANPQGSTHQPVTDSAEALYLTLTAAPLFDTEPQGAVEFKASEVADTDGDGLKEFVDAWGNPLRFYRWPTRLIRAAATPTDSQTVSATIAGPPSGPGYVIQVNPQFTGTSGVSARLLISSITIPSTTPLTLTFALEGASNQPLAKDPDDPGALLDITSTYSGNPQSSSTNATTFENAYHTPDTFFVPLIVSMGPDLQLGLFEPYDTTNHGNLCQPRTDLSATDAAGLSALFDNITNQQQ